MKDNFEASLKQILKFEGGYVNHPADPGGCTNLGITRAALQTHLAKNVTCTDIKNLTQSVAASIYKNHYWHPIQGDYLPSGIDLLVFDMAVNAGPRVAAKMLQGLVGTDKDGRIGPITLKATSERYTADPLALIRDYSQAREKFYRSLSHFPTFGKGWLNRVAEATKSAITLNTSHQPPSLSPEKQDITAELLAVLKQIGILVANAQVKIGS